MSIQHPASRTRLRLIALAALFATAAAAAAAQPARPAQAAPPQPETYAIGSPQDYGGFISVALSSAEIYNGNLFSAPSSGTSGPGSFFQAPPAVDVVPNDDGTFVTVDSGTGVPSAVPRRPVADLFSRFGTAIETG